MPAAYGASGLSHKLYRLLAALIRLGMTANPIDALVAGAEASLAAPFIGPKGPE